MESQTAGTGTGMPTPHNKMSGWLWPGHTGQEPGQWSRGTTRSPYLSEEDDLTAAEMFSIENKSFQDHQDPILGPAGPNLCIHIALQALQDYSVPVLRRHYIPTISGPSFRSAMTLTFMRSNQIGSGTDTEGPLCPSLNTTEDPGSAIDGQPKITEESYQKSQV